ncbi:DUF1592 domain-containing protein [Haliangium ochraceum]|nr:DUF1592 domain-containing protein [Haliangium ochraceum]
MSKLGSVILTPVLFAAVGCSGGGDSTGGDRPASCTSEISPGPAPIRRLTREEYNNTVFQLLGDSTFPANAFAPDEEANGFSNQASALVVSPLLAEQYMGSAEALAASHADTLLQRNMAQCASGADTQTCEEEAEAFVRGFGKQAFRRPLSEDEVQAHVALFLMGSEGGADGYAPAAGVELVVQAMLQSPHFLYRVEFGREGTEKNGIVELSSYEVASRLSYLFWGTMPDAALFEAADRDELRTPEQIEVQARRMVNAPRARDAVKNFHRQWLNLDEIPGIAAIGRNREIYPDYRESLLPLLQRETEEFLDYAIFEANASVEDMYTAPYTMMNAELAEFYGIENGPTGSEFERVDLDGERYSGLLTHAGILALHSRFDSSSPVHRGLFVRTQLLCQPPPPPPDFVPEPPVVDPNVTTREQYRQHSDDPGCSRCHQLMDPLGLGFEHFDALGRYRETQSGLAIDDSGTIVDADADGTPAAESIDGPFDGPVELGARLGNSSTVRECVSAQWFRFAYGRAETEADDCSMDTINQRFADSGYDIKELLVALTQTDAFRYRPITTEVSE